MITQIPNGFDELIATFGNCNNPDFFRQDIVMFRLPYELLFNSYPVIHSQCHKLAVDNFTQALTKIKEGGYENICKNYGGIYAQRSKRGLTGHPSTHSWGIAIDMEPDKYPLGSDARFPDEVIRIFADAGFVYGGDFQYRKDPMHFQLVKNY